MKGDDAKHEPPSNPAPTAALHSSYPCRAAVLQIRPPALLPAACDGPALLLFLLVLLLIHPPTPTWKCALVRQRASCLNSGTSTRWNSSGCVSSSISSSSPRNSTSFWLLVTGQNLSSCSSTGSASLGSFSTNCCWCWGQMKEEINNSMRRGAAAAKG